MTPVPPPEGGFGALRSSTEQRRDEEMRFAQVAFREAMERAEVDEREHQSDRARIGRLFGRPAGHLRRLS